MQQHWTNQKNISQRFKSLEVPITYKNVSNICFCIISDESDSHKDYQHDENIVRQEVSLFSNVLFLFHTMDLNKEIHI